MKDLASNDLNKLRKEHQVEIEKLKNEYESMKMNYESKIVQNVEQVVYFTIITFVRSIYLFRWPNGQYNKSLYLRYTEYMLELFLISIGYLPISSVLANTNYLFVDIETYFLFKRTCNFDTVKIKIEISKFLKHF